jgi:predicted metal-dependent hydrolase
VRITTGGNRGYWSLNETGGELWLAARPSADLAQIVRRTLQRRALEHFRPRLETMVSQIGLAAPPLALSSARTRWGSCSARSGIRLNWRLIHLPPTLIDYVIAHEVAHLVEMNHSPRFWAVVEKLHPDWRTARQELKRLGAALPLI